VGVALVEVSWVVMAEVEVVLVAIVQEQVFLLAQVLLTRLP
jgi:uncharacterized membrane protein